MSTVGVGIDAGTSFIKGAAIQLQEDGSWSLLEAIAIPTSEFAAKGGEFTLALSKHRSSAFSSNRPALCMSSAESGFDRVRVQVHADSPDISDSVIRGWILEGKIPPPGEITPKTDLWDFELLHLYRRNTDIERFGMKCADGMFAKVSAAAASQVSADLKGVNPESMEPSSLALLNYSLSFIPQMHGHTLMVADIGHSRIEGLLIHDTELVKVFRIPLDDLIALVADRASIPPDQAIQRLRNADLTATDSINGAIRDTVGRALASLKQALEAPALPKPARFLICGGLSTLRGAVRLAHSSLDAPCDLLSMPETIRTQISFQSPFSLFPSAIGAALRAAGATSISLLPKKPTAKAAAAALSASMKEASTETGGDQPAVASWMEMARGALAALTDAGRTGLELPARLGRTWLVLGLVSVIALLPTLWLWMHQGSNISSTRREIEMLAPDSSELERQAKLVTHYAELTRKGTLALIPWGEVVSEIAVLMPGDTYITSLNANSSRLMIIGRVRGSMSARLQNVVEQFKLSPALKRQGIIPPDL